MPLVIVVASKANSAVSGAMDATLVRLSPLVWIGTCSAKVSDVLWNAACARCSPGQSLTMATADSAHIAGFRIRTWPPESGRTEFVDGIPVYRKR